MLSDRQALLLRMQHLRDQMHGAQLAGEAKLAEKYLSEWQKTHKLIERLSVE